MTNIASAMIDVSSSQLCASCELCRTKKTKCDGKSPCSNCVARYIKLNKIESIENVDSACIDCVYSFAKRRGPTPGRQKNNQLGVLDAPTTSISPPQEVSPQLPQSSSLSRLSHVLGQKRHLPQHFPNNGIIANTAGSTNTNFNNNNSNNKIDSLLVACSLGGIGGNGSAAANMNINAMTNGDYSKMSLEELNLLLAFHEQQQQHQQQQMQQQILQQRQQQQNYQQMQQEWLLQQILKNGTASASSVSNILRGGITNSNNLGAAGVMTTNTGMMEGMNNSNHSTPELTFAQNMALPGGMMRGGITNSNNLGGAGVMTNGAAGSPELSFAQKMALPAGMGNNSNNLGAAGLMTNTSRSEGMYNNNNNASQDSSAVVAAATHLQQQKELLHQVTEDQHHEEERKVRKQEHRLSGMSKSFTNGYSSSNDNNDNPCIRPSKTRSIGSTGDISVDASLTSTAAIMKELPISVARHLPLLQPNSTDGAVLRSYYELSTNDVLNLPPIPTDEEYLDRLSTSSSLSSNTSNGGKLLLPTFDQSALRAARFAEIALGALANEQLSLARELINACAVCLRDCVNSPAHPSCMYDVSRAYFLLGVIHSFRGDMLRYFKYRRVCMNFIQKLESTHKTQAHVEAILAAITFHDAFIYIIHNGCTDCLPNIDSFLPSISETITTNISSEVGRVSNISSVIVTNPINQTWMQGSPQIFLNNEANLLSRSIDALSCAIRSCCDFANMQYEQLAKASGIELDNTSGSTTPTFTAVMANEDELCSRNLILSAKTLLDQHSIISATRTKNYGLTFIACAMSAFIEDSSESYLPVSLNDEFNFPQFTTLQIKNLLSSCDIIIQHPLLLCSPGPVYHMAGNVAVMLCHLLNEIYSKWHTYDAKDEENDDNSSTPSNHSTNNAADSRLFEETLDSYISIRNILHKYRKSLPVKLRCHGLPRPSGLGLYNNKDESTKKEESNTHIQKSFIDMEETLVCPCRGCQGFVLRGCSPCVAAERVAKATRQKKNGQEDRNRDDNSPLRISRDGDEFRQKMGGRESSSQRENSDTDDELLNLISLIMNTNGMNTSH